MKVLHVLQMSLPNTSGYSIRSKYIVKSQKNAGIHPIVITSPFQEKGDKQLDSFDGIEYYRSKSSAGSSKSKMINRMKYLYMIPFYKDILKICKKEKPDIIHAHSSFFCGVPALWVAKKLNIPIIYEVRGVWEDTAVVNNSLKKDSFQYKVIRKLENHAAKNSNRLITISKGLKKEFISRGIEESKVNVVTNGVDINNFKYIDFQDKDLLKQHNLEGKIVLGYVGSVIKLEGLEYLIKAIKKIITHESNIHLLIVGDGKERGELERQVNDLGLQNSITFVGRVPHELVNSYYSIMDMVVLPRINNVVSNIVTPLKPLEIMAVGRPLIASDVGGITEFVEDGINGILFESENVEDLALKILKLINSQKRRDELSRQAREWVCSEKSWDKLAYGYVDIYKELLDEEK